MMKVDRKTEIYVCGQNAVWSVFSNRPNDIIKFFYDAKNEKNCAKIIEFMAKNKKGFKRVTTDELEKLAKSQHHEGLVMLTKRKSPMDLDQILKIAPKNCTMVYLENVANPHNIGAIMRSMAHFGALALLVTESSHSLSAASMRNAEGGGEVVEIVEVTNPKLAIEKFIKAGFKIITTSSHVKTNIYSQDLKGKVLFVFGEEHSGLSEQVMKLGTSCQIPGTGKVESLNVSVATAVVLSEYYRQNN